MPGCPSRFARVFDNFLKWTGSRFFSSSFGSAANRTAFVKTITTLVDKHKLDGIDFECVSPLVGCSWSKC